MQLENQWILSYGNGLINENSEVYGYRKLKRSQPGVASEGMPYDCLSSM